MSNKSVYPLTGEINTIKMDVLSDSIYFRAFPKQGVEAISEILNDTLRSHYISLKENDKSLSLDLDCHPFYFARIVMADDTLKNIRNRKIKWNGEIFTR